MNKTAPIADSLAKDGNGIPVQIGSGFQTRDGSASPQSSPLSLTGSSQTVVVPLNAVEFIVAPSADLKVSEVSNLASYDTVIAGTKESIPCARISKIYVEGTGTISFRFTML